MIKKVMTFMILMMVIIPQTNADENDQLYYVKVDWKAEASKQDFHSLTTAVYDLLFKQGVILYAEYSNFSGFDILLTSNEQTSKLKHYLDQNNDPNMTISLIDVDDKLSPLYIDFSADPIQYYDQACEVTRIVEIESDELADTYSMDKVVIAARRGYMISVALDGTWQKNMYKADFSASHDCKSIEAIVDELISFEDRFEN